MALCSPIARVAIIGLAGYICAAGVVSASESMRQPVTVADTIAVRRILQAPIENDSASVRYSPDESRYLVVLYRGDTERNVNVVEFFSGGTGSVDEAARGEAVAALVSEEHSISIFRNTDVIWFPDNERVALIQNAREAPHRILSVNTKSGAIETLVSWPRRIRSFDLSADGRTLLFASSGDGLEAKRAHEELMANGFTVRTDQLPGALMEGIAGARYHSSANEEIVVIRDGGSPRKVRVPRHSAFPASPVLSPDGRWAVLVGASKEDNIPSEWERYTDGLLQERIGGMRDNRSLDLVSQYWLADLQTGEARLLHAGPSSNSKVVWAPDSRKVVIAPAFPPAEISSEDGLAGNVAAVADLDGHLRELPLPAKAWRPPVNLKWEDNRTITLKNADGSGGRARWHDGAWRALPDRKASGAHVSKPLRRVDIEVDQGLNRPPVLMAIDSTTGERRDVLVIDPRQAEFRLGRVQLVDWTDKAGRSWRGRLYLPVDYRAGARYPVVIHCSAGDPALDEFSLLGWEVGGSPLSAAQPLAGRNIAVLAGFAMTSGPSLTASKSSEYPGIRLAIEGAVRELTDLGYADPERIGLTGFSRTGSYALHTITNSDHPFAVSYISDNVKYTYENYVTFASLGPEMGLIYGNHPFGKGLKSWLEGSPNFLLEHVHGPVMLEAMSSLSGTQSQWEIYSLLKQLRKPVELYVVPEARDRGSHPMVLPRQKLASLEQLVDWFDFWLNGREQDDPAKAEQYQRWRKLRELHEEDRKKPRPPRLEWTAREVPRKPVIEGM